MYTTLTISYFITCCINLRHLLESDTLECVDDHDVTFGLIWRHVWPHLRRVKQSGCWRVLAKICVPGIGNFGERSRALTLLNTPLQHKFWRALARTRSAERASDVTSVSPEQLPNGLGLLAEASFGQQWYSELSNPWYPFAVFTETWIKQLHY